MEKLKRKNRGFYFVPPSKEIGVSPLSPRASPRSVRKTRQRQQLSGRKTSSYGAWAGNCDQPVFESDAIEEKKEVEGKEEETVSHFAQEGGWGGEPRSPPSPRAAVGHGGGRGEGRGRGAGRGGATRGGGRGGKRTGNDFILRVRRGAQRRALTVWMNDILSSGGFERVRDVRVELQNGVVLSHLLAALHLPGAQKIKVKKGNSKFIGLDNLRRVIDFLIPLGIDEIGYSPTDINEGKIGPILALLWKIFYQFGICGRIHPDVTKYSPIQKRFALQRWAHSLTQQRSISVNNFSSDFENFFAFSAFIAALDPNYSYDEVGEKKEVLQSCLTHSLTSLHIPPALSLMELEHLVDARAVTIWLSLAAEKYCKWEVYLPLIPSEEELRSLGEHEASLKEIAQFWITGPGSETASVGSPAEFYVAATRRSDNSIMHLNLQRVVIEVTEGKNGKALPCQVLEMMTGCLEVVYSPTQTGNHHIRVSLAENKSEILTETQVKVEKGEKRSGYSLDQLELEISGEGASMCMLGALANFTVIFKKAGGGKIIPLGESGIQGVGITMTNPSTEIEIPLMEVPQPNGSSQFVYSVDSSDRVILSMSFEGESLFENEIQVRTDLHFDISSPQEAVVGKEVEACVVVSNESGNALSIPEGGINFCIIDPTGKEIEIVEEEEGDEERDDGSGKAGTKFWYKPLMSGEHTVEIAYAHNPLTEHKVKVVHEIDNLVGTLKIGERKKEYLVGQKVSIAAVVKNKKTKNPLMPKEYLIVYEGPSIPPTVFDPEASGSMFVQSVPGKYQFALKYGEKELCCQTLKLKNLTEKSACFRVIGTVGGVGSGSNISIGSTNPLIDLSVLFEIKVSSGGESVPIRRRGPTFSFTPMSTQPHQIHVIRESTVVGAIEVEATAKGDERRQFIAMDQMTGTACRIQLLPKMQVSTTQMISFSFSHLESTQPLTNQELQQQRVKFSIVPSNGDEELVSVPAWNGDVAVRSNGGGTMKVRIMAGERVLAAVPLVFVGDEKEKLEIILAKPQEMEEKNRLAQVPPVEENGRVAAVVVSKSSESVREKKEIDFIYSVFDTVVGKKAFLFFLASDRAGTQKIPCLPSDISVISPTKQSVPISVDQSSFTMYRMRNRNKIPSDFFSFVPSESGSHVITVNLFGKQVCQAVCEVSDLPSLSFVNLSAENSHKNISISLKLMKTTPQHHGLIFLQPHGSFDPQLLQIGVMAQTELVPMERRSEREILYIPPSAGTHRILIAYSNELLTTFPFEVELPDAHCVLMSQSTHINLESEICVRLSDKRSGQVLSVVSGAVVVSSPSGEKVPFGREEVDQSTPFFSHFYFTPREKGFYSVFVKGQDKVLAELKIEATTEDTLERHTFYKDTSSDIFCELSSRDGLLHSPIPLSLSLSCLSTSQPLPLSSLNLSVFDPQNGPVSLSASSPSSPSCSFCPQCSGMYRVSVTKEGTELLSTFVRGAEKLEKKYLCILMCSSTYIGGQAIISASVIESISQTHVGVVPKDFQVRDSSGEFIELEEYGAGTFQFAPRVIGPHTIELSHNGAVLASEVLSMSSRNDHVRTIVAHHTGVNISSSLITPDTFVGKPTRLSLTLRDALTQASFSPEKIRENVKLIAVGPLDEGGDIGTTSDVPLTSLGESGNAFQYQFVAPFEGSYCIKLLYQSEEIASAFIQASDPENITCTIIAQSVPINTTGEITVFLTDRSKSTPVPVLSENVVLVAPNGKKVETRPGSDEKANCFGFEPKTSGDHQISIVYLEKVLARYPLTVFEHGISYLQAVGMNSFIGAGCLIGTKNDHVELGEQIFFSFQRCLSDGEIDCVSPDLVACVTVGDQRVSVESKGDSQYSFFPLNENPHKISVFLEEYELASLIIPSLHAEANSKKLALPSSSSSPEGLYCVIQGNDCLVGEDLFFQVTVYRGRSKDKPIQISSESLCVFDSDENRLDFQLQEKGEGIFSVILSKPQPGIKTLAVYDNGTSISYLSARVSDDCRRTKSLNILNQLLELTCIIQARGTVVGKSGSVQTQVFSSSSQTFEESYNKKFNFGNDHVSEFSPESHEHLVRLSALGPAKAAVPTMKESSGIYRYSPSVAGPHTLVLSIGDTIEFPITVDVKEAISEMMKPQICVVVYSGWKVRYSVVELRVLPNISSAMTPLKKEELSCAVFSTAEKREQIPFEREEDLSSFEIGALCFQHTSPSYSLSISWEDIPIFDVDLDLSGISQTKMRVTAVSEKYGTISADMDQIQCIGEKVLCDLKWSDPLLLSGHPIDLRLTQGQEIAGFESEGKGPKETSFTLSPSLVGTYKASLLSGSVEIASFPVEIISGRLKSFVEGMAGLFSFQPATLKIRVWDEETKFDLSPLTNLIRVSLLEQRDGGGTLDYFSKEEGSSPALYYSFTPEHGPYTLVLTTSLSERPFHIENLLIEDSSQYLMGSIQTSTVGSVGRPHRIQANLTNSRTGLSVKLPDLRIVFNMTNETPVEASTIDYCHYELTARKPGAGAVDMIWRNKMLSRKAVKFEHNVDDLSCEIHPPSNLSVGSEHTILVDLMNTRVHLRVPLRISDVILTDPTGAKMALKDKVAPIRKLKKKETPIGMQLDRSPLRKSPKIAIPLNNKTEQSKTPTRRFGPGSVQTLKAHTLPSPQPGRGGPRPRSSNMSQLLPPPPPVPSLPPTLSPPPNLPPPVGFSPPTLPPAQYTSPNLPPPLLSPALPIASLPPPIATSPASSTPSPPALCVSPSFPPPITPAVPPLVLRRSSVSTTSLLHHSDPIGSARRLSVSIPVRPPSLASPPSTPLTVIPQASCPNLISALAGEDSPSPPLRSSPLNATPEPNNSLTFLFAPKRPGPHTIVVQYEGEKVSSKSFVVEPLVSQDVAEEPERSSTVYVFHGSGELKPPVGVSTVYEVSCYQGDGEHHQVSQWHPQISVYVKSPDRFTVQREVNIDHAKNIVRVSFVPVTQGVHLIELHSNSIEYRKHGELDSSLVARFAVQVEKKKGNEFISENLIHVNTLDHDEVLSRYQLDGTIFCIDIDSSNTVLNDLRKKMNKAILERVANSTPKQRETLSRWLLCFEFYALDEGNKMYKLEGTEKAEQFSHQMIQANRMAVFKTQDKKTKSEEATKIKKKRRKSIVGADKLKKDVGGHVQASLEKTDSSSIWKQTSKRTVIQIIYKIGPNRWNFDVNYPPNRVYVGGHYDIFIKVKDPYQGGKLVNELGKESRLEAHITTPSGEILKLRALRDFAEDGIFSVRLAPKMAGKHKSILKFNEFNLQHKPATIVVHKQMKFSLTLK